MIKTTILEPTTANLQLAAAALQAGEVVGMPTETVYGLAANALNPDAVRRIFAVKGRPADNPLIVHISVLAEIDDVVAQFSTTAQALAKAFWPGPLTMILPKHPQVPDEVTTGLTTVGVRMPSDPTARALIQAAGVPLAAPSANTSGKPSPTTAEHVRHDLDGKLRYIVDGGSCAIGLESTVALIGEDEVVILRPGAVTAEDFAKVVKTVTTDSTVLAGVSNPTQPVASPGMKYKHYAPAAALTLVEGTLAAFYRQAVNEEQEGFGVLIFEGEEWLFSCPTFTYGRASDSESQAEELFAALRAIDASGLQKVLVRMPPIGGVGMAVYNRLLRACAFRRLCANRLFVIGLTGPTGSGKSLVAAEFKARFGTVLDCDKLARAVRDLPAIQQALCTAFGADLLVEGTLDRQALAARAFATPAAHQALDQIMYPAITKALLRRLRDLQGLVLVDAPTLFESGVGALCDVSMAVIAPKEVRLARILARDHITREQAEARMRVQHAEAYYRNRADFLLENQQDTATLLQKAGEAFDRFKEKAAKISIDSHL